MFRVFELVDQGHREVLDGNAAFPLVVHEQTVDTPTSTMFMDPFSSLSVWICVVSQWDSFIEKQTQERLVPNVPWDDRPSLYCNSICYKAMSIG